MSVAKSWWKSGPKMAKLVKFSKKWHISLEFQPEVVLFPPEVSCFFQNFQGFQGALWQKVLKIWLGFAQNAQKTGSSSISAGSQLFFQNFQGFTLCLWQKVLKIWLGFAQNAQKITGTGNRRLRNLEFGPKIKFFKASPQLFWQKVADFCHRKRKWGPKLLKNHVFWKKTRAFWQKVWNLQDF